MFSGVCPRTGRGHGRTTGDPAQLEDTKRRPRRVPWGRRRGQGHRKGLKPESPAPMEPGASARWPYCSVGYRAPGALVPKR